MQTTLFGDDIPDGPSEGRDVAYTRVALAQRLVAYLEPELEGKVIMEPHSGGGALLGPLAETGCRLLLATEIDPAAAAMTGSTCHDFLEGLPGGWPRPDAIVGNVPFSDAAAHFMVSFKAATELVAYITQACRHHRNGPEWLKVWAAAWPDEILALGRVSFDGPGRDHGGKSAMTDCEVLIFRKRRGSWVGRGITRRMFEDGSIYPPKE
jgi:hypothetical protein